MNPRIQQYLNAIAQLHHDGAASLVSVILFGSSATGATSDSSDVDLILVLPDDANYTDRVRLRGLVADLEITYGFREPAKGRKNPLELYMEHAGGEAHSCFLCTRADLLSGSAGRVFGLSPAEALFVDRIVLATAIASARSVWGEELLPRVFLPPIRRLDVFKALLGLGGLAFISFAAFPILPDATRYAMGALKHSLHSCYFCYHLRNAPLSEEVEFFNGRLGKDRTLLELLILRQEYRRSFSFVVRCLLLILRLHLSTARQVRFPREVPRKQ
uniref:Polymerase nucleotidyl transferase domain-containing protein n=1 Tax=Solibacter usitatus (strain Ellin6076) TaxID=234267 RepID=Q01Y61_SOLUE